MLVLDVGQGSAGSALVRISQTEAPKLFGEFRAHLPVGEFREIGVLARHAKQTATQALLHAAEVASRVRQHPAAGAAGVIESVAVFLAPPWGAPDLAREEPEFSNDMAEALRDMMRAHLEVPHRLHTRAGAALHGARVIFPGDALLLIISTEAMELLHAKDGAAVSYAFIPVGTHVLLRTLRAHGGLSWQEARSALRIGHRHFKEPLDAAYDHLARELSAAMRGLRNPPRSVLVLAEEPYGERLARELADRSEFSTLFPQGSTIRPMLARHASPYVAAHAQSLDLNLMLEALYLDSIIQLS